MRRELPDVLSDNLTNRCLQNRLVGYVSYKENPDHQRPVHTTQSLLRFRVLPASRSAVIRFENPHLLPVQLVCYLPLSMNSCNCNLAWSSADTLQVPV